ncbi:putative methionine aminopeptidase A [Desulfamplus magnetovallimortis]|uniref:Methionine aminopeptidase n=1 Tax=Desulfamplus magnetovallimortis TaxID=1246637 RepID=A0A1W1HKY2_9BACT|nr:type I methionyl aminopeptidase [Desulfamplus magnetovallimortis]SLM33008.1 putative methionine aminopeptidase A [Desulfamplus magnetovallimortis]
MKNQTTGTKIGRNAPCPCGSGKKYKTCCMNMKNFSVNKPLSLKQEYRRKFNIIIKEPHEIEGIRKTGKLLLAIMEKVEDMIRPGITTDDINTLVHEETIRAGAVPAPLHYRGFPKSVCVSVNEVICHGIPGKRILKDGDIVNVDITPILNGYYADANKTFFVGSATPDGEKIVSVAKESLKRGIEIVKPGVHIGNIGWAIQRFAEKQGCSVVREFVGHGVGLDFHEQPQVLHFGKKGQGVVLVPGMVFTIEPMINLGSRKLHILKDKWTAVTNDGSLSAQFEQTILVTDNGWESLTPYDL